MSTTKKKYILFDFDGVIADSKEIAFSVSKTICPNLTDELYSKRFEGNINDWEEPIHPHGSDCRHDLDFFTEYLPKFKDVKVFPKMEEVITALEKDFGLIVVSSSLTSPISNFLAMHDLSKHFTEIMGNDVHASKVEKIKMVFEKYTTGPADCVFVTDTLGDMREAKKMDVASIGVTWGFHGEDRLALGNPFRIVKKPEEIPVAVSDYFQRR